MNQREPKKKQVLISMAIENVQLMQECPPKHNIKTESGREEYTYSLQAMPTVQFFRE